MAAVLPDEQNEQVVKNPLQGYVGVLILALLALSMVLVAFIVCSQAILIKDSTREFALELFLGLVGLGWCAFTICERISLFIVTWLLISLLCAPIILMVLIQDPYTFWISLLLVGTFAVMAVLSKCTLSFWQSIIVSVYVFWIVTGLVVTIGNTEVFSYARPVTSLKEVHLFLDIRYMVSVLLFLIFIGKALWKAFQAEVPKIPSIPKITIPEFTSRSSTTAAFIRPFVLGTNVSLTVIWILLEVLWKVTAYAVVYLYRTSAHLVNQFFELASKAIIWFSMLPVILTFFLIICFSYGVKLTGPHLFYYLTNATPLSAISIGSRGGIALEWILGLYIGTLVGILFICRLWKFDERLNRAAECASTLIVALVPSGFAIYAASRLPSLKIRGFDSIGPISYLILIIVGGFFLTQLIRELMYRKSRSLQN